jgi:SAM-dependent methyltransferase
MEALPFPSQHFDVVACAGGLSYGDNQKTLAEICRVLKHGGYFLAVDSLNHNPIYKFNRFLHYLRGNRTRGTLIRMPTLTLLDNYRRTIGTSEVRFFGTLSWLLMPISRFIGEDRAAVWSDRVDEILSVKRSAFKFVLISRKIAIDAS